MKQAKRIILGAAATLLLYLALLALAALLVVRGTVGEEHSGTFIWISAFLAAFVCAKAASLRAGDALQIFGSVSAFWALIQMFGFLAGGGLDGTRSLALILPVLSGGALAYLLRPKRRQHRVHK